MLVLAFHFQEVRQHANRSAGAIECTRLKQSANRIGGVAMLVDHRFERRAFAESRGVFRAKPIQLTLAFHLFATLGFERLAGGTDLRRKGIDAVGSRFELNADLATLSAEGFDLR